MRTSAVSRGKKDDVHPLPADRPGIRSAPRPVPLSPCEPLWSAVPALTLDQVSQSPFGTRALLTSEDPLKFKVREESGRKTRNRFQVQDSGF